MCDVTLISFLHAVTPDSFLRLSPEQPAWLIGVRRRQVIVLLVCVAGHAVARFGGGMNSHI